MLTERLQRAAIWRLAQGNADPGARPEKFEEPWRTIYLLLERGLTLGVEFGDGGPLEWAVTEANVLMPSASDYWDQVDAMVDSIKRAERQFKPRNLARWPGWRDASAN